MMLFFMSGCSSKKVVLDDFRADIVDVNKRVDSLNRELVLEICSVEKENLLKVQEENHATIDKVLYLDNLLSYSDFSYKDKKEIEESLNKVLEHLFILRQRSRDRLVELDSSKIDRSSVFPKKKSGFLCNIERKPISEKEDCVNCRAVLN